MGNSGWLVSRDALLKSFHTAKTKKKTREKRTNLIFFLKLEIFPINFDENPTHFITTRIIFAK